jgi:DNA-binding response OmpR family regulator
MKVALEGEGFKVDTFDSPELSLSSFKPNLYDFILLDIKMPKQMVLNFREIKKRDNKAKVCFLTASEYIEYEEFLKDNPKVPMKCFARKPIPIDELAKIVKEELEEE